MAAANGGTCDENDSFQSYVDANPSVGAGPYQITAYTSGSEVLLEKYADATVQTGYVDKFIIKNIADANTQQMEIEAGDIDFALDPVSYTHLDVYKRQVPITLLHMLWVTCQ